jgi:hypothetical protein
VSARIAELAEGQRGRMVTWAQEWITRGLAPGRGRGDARKAEVDVWVDGVHQPVRGSVAGVLSGALHMTVRSAVSAAITEPVHQAVMAGVHKVVHRGLVEGIHSPVHHAVTDAVGRAAAGTLAGGVRAAALARAEAAAGWWWVPPRLGPAAGFRPRPRPGGWWRWTCGATACRTSRGTPTATRPVGRRPARRHRGAGPGAADPLRLVYAGVIIGDYLRRDQHRGPGAVPRPDHPHPAASQGPVPRPGLQRRGAPARPPGTPEPDPQP